MIFISLSLGVSVLVALESLDLPATNAEEKLRVDPEEVRFRFVCFPRAFLTQSCDHIKSRPLVHSFEAPVTNTEQKLCVDHEEVRLLLKSHVKVLKA